MESSEKLEELDQSRLSKASDTTREVSYAVLDVSPKNTTGVLEKFAITINVQLTLQPGQEIPFIPFNGFDKVKEASKLFFVRTKWMRKIKMHIRIGQGLS